MNAPSSWVRTGWAVLHGLLFGLVCGLSGCDASGYRQRNGDWTHDGDRIAPLAPASFEPIDRLFARDALHGYYRGSVVDDSHGPSFEALSAHEARDRGAVYWCDTERRGQEYWSIRRVRISRIADADPVSYRVLGRGYARDARRVYDEGVPFDVRDPSSFEPMDAGFGRDRQRGYHVHAEIPGSDGATFATVNADDAAYVRDRQHVWYGFIDIDRPGGRPGPVVRLLRDADPAVVRVLGRGYAADASRVWYRGLPLPDADAASFRIETSFVGEVDAFDRAGRWQYGRRVPKPSSPPVVKDPS